MSDNESLFNKLTKADVLEEFCALMFDQQVTYEDLLEQLEKWGISSSIGALSRFSVSQRSAWTLQRAKLQYESILNDNGVDLDEAQRKVVAERLYAMASSPLISEKALLKMRDQEIKLALLNHDRQRLEQAEQTLQQRQEVIDLQKRKIEALEAQAAAVKEDLKDGGLTDAERAARMRARFGL